MARRSADSDAPVRRDPRDLLVGGDIDLVNYEADHKVQLARCRRAIDRFTHFENGPATADEAAGLVDRFLDAGVALHHCRDWFKKAAKAEALPTGFVKELDSSTQRVLADIANAAKHAQLDRPRRSTGKVVLSTTLTTAAESLADYYRRMRIMTDGKEVHPADFLAVALQEFEAFGMAFIALPALERKRRLQSVQNRF